jgi:quinohemoprotein ethanol dehydrogenase
MEGRLKAWNPLSSKPDWVSPPLAFLNGGTLSTAGGLVFQGTADGILSIYGARGGRLLKRIVTGTVIMAAPITYLESGVQYVAVLAGAGGPQNVAWGAGVVASRYANFERLLVFRLGGGAVPLPPRIMPPLREPTPKHIAADAPTLQRGALLFGQQCARCHVDGGAIGAYPDLWNMPQSAVDSFGAIVRDGALRFAGMGNFSDTLSRSDIAAVEAFIVDDEIARREHQKTTHTPSRIRYH